MTFGVGRTRHLSSEEFRLVVACEPYKYAEIVPALRHARRHLHEPCERCERKRERITSALERSQISASGSSPFLGRPVDEAPKHQQPAGLPSRYQNLLFHERGGLGEIFKADDVKLGRVVAIKRMRKERQNDGTSRARFQREGEIPARLNHPGIVSVYDQDCDSNREPYYVMQFIEGETLHRVLQQQSDSAPADKNRSDQSHQLMRWFRILAETIAYAHDQGVIHRDLTPVNVLIGRHGDLVVIDWGGAKVLPDALVRDEKPALAQSDDPQRASRWDGEAQGSQGFRGTQGYASPEQTHDRSVDRRTDVYSLGAVLCEIMTGRPVLPDRPGQSEDDARQAAYDRLRSLEGHARLVDLCLRCLQVKPDDRPLDAGEIVRKLNEYDQEVRDEARRAQIKKERARFLMVAAVAASVVICASIAGFTGWSYLSVLRSRLARIELGAELFAAGKHEEARDVLDTVLNEANNKGEPRPLLVDVLIAQTLYDSGNLNETAKHCRKALEVHIGNAGLEACLAHCYWGLGLSREAIPTLRGIAKKQPNSVVAGYHLIEALFEADEGSQAAAAAKTLLDRPDGSGEGLVVLARLLSEHGEDDLALKAYNRAYPSVGEIEREDHPDRSNAAMRSSEADQPAVTRPLYELMAHTDAAEILLSQGDTALAEKHLRFVLKANPGSNSAHRLLGKTLQSRDRPDEAAEEFRRLLDSSPADADALFAYESILTRLDRPNEALRYYENALSGGRANPSVQHAYFHALTRAGRLARATELCEQAMREGRKGFDVASHLVSALAAQGRLTEAFQVARKFHVNGFDGQSSSAGAIVVERIVFATIQPFNGSRPIGTAPSLSHQSLNSLFREHSLKDAGNETRSFAAATSQPNTPQGATEKIRLCDELLKRDPNFLDALALRARTRSEAGSFDEARTDFKELVRSDGENPARWQDFAKFLVRKGELDDALVKWRKFASMTQIPILNCIEFSDALLAAHADAAAKETLTQLGAHERTTADDALWLADALDRAHMVDDAEREYGKAVELDGKDPRSLRKQAAFLLKLERFEGAMTARKRALELAHDDLEGDLTVVRNLLRAKRGDLAKSLLEAVEKAYPPGYSLFECQGDVLRALDDEDGASAAYQKALTIEPNGHGAAWQLLMSRPRLEAFARRLRGEATRRPDDVAVAVAQVIVQMWITGDHDESVKAFERIVEQNPQNLLAAGYLAYELRQAGANEKATELLKRLHRSIDTLELPEDPFVPLQRNTRARPNH
jgi:tetratricopeptide (TPR) repeat protein/tRNA A-37 threonylcarbamoyl transferase component Bud32